VPPWYRRLASWLVDGWQGRAVVLALVALGALLASSITGRDAGDPLTQRALAQGGVVLSLTRETPEGAEIVPARSPVGAVDELRLSVVLPRAGYLLVVAVDAAGALTRVWPAAGPGAAGQVARGAHRPLEGAELSSLGEGGGGAARLVGVLCERPFTLADLGADLAGGARATPEGCLVGRFELAPDGL